MSRRQCVIVSGESDYHACAARHAIRAAGGSCEILDTTRLIHHEAPAAYISLSSSGMEVGGILQASTEKSVWARRMFRIKDMNAISPLYARYIYSETREFEQNVFKGLELDELNVWVNRPSAVTAAELKSYQLSIAQQCGLNVPDTLITADPSIARTFCDRLGTVVMKPFSPHSWLDDTAGKKWMTFASKVTSKDISSCDDADISAAPCIYQKYISTTADIRVAIIGEELFALEMRHEVPGKIDFRTMGEGELSFSQCAVPISTAMQLKLLMRRLNIEIASADFILDDNGQWHFIELNPSGAFLFLEERCPNIKVLSATASFLCYGSVREGYGKEFPPLASFIGSPDHATWLVEKEHFDELNQNRGNVTNVNEV